MINTLEARDELLREQGYARTEEVGHLAYRRNGLALTFEEGSDWATLVASNGFESAGSDFARPGPWKIVRVKETGAPVTVADLPLPNASDGIDTAAMAYRMSVLLAWAEETLKGDSTRMSGPVPDEDALRPWLVGSSLSFQVGAHLRPIELVRDEGRGVLAFEMRIVPQVPQALSACRRAWLSAILNDAHQRYRLVRAGLEMRHNQEVALLQVEFSGAPPDLLEWLIPQGMACLRRVAAGLVPLVALIADASVNSSMLESTVPFMKQEDLS